MPLAGEYAQLRPGDDLGQPPAVGGGHDPILITVQEQDRRRDPGRVGTPRQHLSLIHI